MRKFVLRISNCFKRLKRHVRDSSEGFSLIEIAITLTILGIVGGLGVSYLTNTLRQRQTQIRALTKARQERILTALASYVSNGNWDTQIGADFRLPYAAAPDATGDQFGREQGQEGPIIGVRKHLVVGIVPFKTLGLREEDVKDGHGNYFTYVVDEYLAQPGRHTHYHVTSEEHEIKGDSINDPLSSAFNEPDIISNNQAASSGNKSGYTQTVPKKHSICGVVYKNLTLTARAGKIQDPHPAVILISHGPQGAGAYRCNGTLAQIPAQKGLNRYAKANNESIRKRRMSFYAFPYSVGGKTPFQQQVTYVTRDFLLAYYGKRPCR